jgi:hypothetical protein
MVTPQRSVSGFIASALSVVRTASAFYGIFRAIDENPVSDDG